MDKKVYEHCRKAERYPFILIGNKLDLLEENDQKRAVTEDETKKLCDDHRLFWGGEISVKTINYDEFQKLFEDYFKIIYKKVGDKILRQQYIELQIKKKIKDIVK